MGMMNGCWGGFGWMGLGMLVNILLGLGLLALVVVGVVFAVRWLTGARGESPGGRSKDDAIEIVRTRYARGEISHEEFDRLRRELA
ncbi:MAG: SHOCT domain-containing protein [Candidatus Rokuibacteriota bacterium]